MTRMMLSNNASKAALSLLLLVLLATGAGTQANRPPAEPQPQEVVFQSGKLQLHGFLWKPDGPGPFPVVIWNHGSEKMPGSHSALGNFYTSHFYVLFVPHRHGQGRSPGDYIQDQVMQAAPERRGRRMVELQEEAVEDVVAAVKYLKSQPFADPQRVAISGCSYGGIQTLLAGERDLGVKALVPFAPGAMSWDKNTAIRDRLRTAVDRAKAPIFLLQAENDYNLAPSYELAKEAEKKHKDFQNKIYPPVGTTNQDGHWKFCATATDVWGPDVLAFLAARMKQ